MITRAKLLLFAALAVYVLWLAVNAIIHTAPTPVISTLPPAAATNVQTIGPAVPEIGDLAERLYKQGVLDGCTAMMNYLTYSNRNDLSAHKDFIYGLQTNLWHDFLKH